MTVSLVQNFFKQTVTTPWTVGTGNFYVSQKPNVTSGFLVISPNSESLREIVAFSAVGTDGGGDYVTVSARGLGGTTEQAHGAGEKVYMNITAQHIEQIKQAIEDINNAGALNASTTVKGVARLTTSPNVSLGNPTITIASPAVVTLTAHGLTENDEIQFTTDGALPTGITSGTKYYVIATGLTANEFQFSETFGGVAVNTSGSQSGTHTLTKVTPVAAGENDTRFPTTDQSAALAGDGGIPSASNPFILKNRPMIAGATIAGATLPVPVYQNKTDNEFYACDANDTAAMKFLGFATSDGTDGAVMNVQFSGIVSGFTGLLEGEKYYVQDAVGTIGTTIGTYEILVGVAISTTELLIQKGKRRASGSTDISAVAATGSQVITCGFRPSRIRLFGLTGDVGSVPGAIMDATWDNGVITGVAMFPNAGSTISVASNRLYDASSYLAYLTFTITSVTDTGFTITYTETGTWTNNMAGYKWEAEGEL